MTEPRSDDDDDEVLRGLPSPFLPGWDQRRRRQLFLRAMTTWMQGAGYHVGITGAGLDEEPSTEVAKAAVGAAATAAGLGAFATLIAPFVATDVSPATVTEALTPFAAISDILGLHTTGREVLAVIVADELSVEEFRERLDLLFAFNEPLARIIQRWERSELRVMFAYLGDELTRYVAHWKPLDAMGSRRTDRFTLEAGQVNFAGDEIVAPESLGSLRWFSDHDLGRVTALMRMYGRGT
jgi:hypothetical protein